MLNINRPDWQIRASCRALPLDLFFPSNGVESSRNLNVIKPFCDVCPVRVECLACAMSHPDEKGIWAGTTENDRRRMRSKNYNDRKATPMVYSDGKYRQVKDPT